MIAELDKFNMCDLLDIHSVLVFTVVLLGIYLYVSTWLPKNFPPGPMRLPIIGSILAMGTNRDEMHIALTGMSKKYGPVVGLKFGSYPVVILNSLESIKEALVTKGDQFRNRPHFMKCVTQVTCIKDHGPVRGVIWSHGERWKRSRRFALSSLRDFGMGKRSIEQKIQEEAVALCSELMDVTGQPFDVHLLFQECVSNIICSICFGARFEYTDPVFNKLMQMLRYNFQSDVLSSAVNFIPMLRVLPETEKMRNVLVNAAALDDWVETQIESHRETFDAKEIRDFVDLYLLNEKEDSRSVALSAEDIGRLIVDLFAAGTETTTTGLRWALLFLMLNPVLQKKNQEEIDNIIGVSRSPSLADRQKTPYLEGVINECFRVGNILPVGLPHMAECDTTLSGYNIPKYTMIMANFYKIHMDDKYFKNPEEFKPERWIGPDGKFQKNDAFFAFSMGPRVCLGETLARSEMFLFLSSMLQRFSFRVVDPSNPPGLGGKMGVTHSPKKFQVIIESR